MANSNLTFVLRSAVFSFILFVRCCVCDLQGSIFYCLVRIASCPSIFLPCSAACLSLLRPRDSYHRPVDLSLWRITLPLRQDKQYDKRNIQHFVDSLPQLSRHQSAIRLLFHPIQPLRPRPASCRCFLASGPRCTFLSFAPLASDPRRTQREPSSYRIRDNGESTVNWIPGFVHPLASRWHSPSASDPANRATSRSSHTNIPPPLDHQPSWTLDTKNFPAWGCLPMSQ